MRTNQNQTRLGMNDSFFDTLIALIQSHEEQLTKQNDEIKEQNIKMQEEIRELKQNVNELNSKIDELQNKKKNAKKNFKMFYKRNQEHVTSLYNALEKYEKLSENLQKDISDIKNILKQKQQTSE